MEDPSGCGLAFPVGTHDDLLNQPSCYTERMEVSARTRFLVGVLSAMGLEVGCSCGDDHPAPGIAFVTHGSSSTGDEDSTSGSTSTMGDATTEGATESTSDLPIESSSSDGGMNLCGNGEADPTEICLGEPIAVATDLPTAALVADDLDGDGHIDIAAGHDQSFSVRFGFGNQTFTEPVTFATESGVLALVAADLDTNGVLDLVVADSGVDAVIVYLADGARGFVAQAPVGVGPLPRGLATGDFDGDGFIDIASSNEEGGNVTVLVGDGTGSLTVGQELVVGSAPSAIVAADFDADQTVDLLLANFGGRSLSLFRGSDTGFGDELGLATLPGPRALAVLDFDGDTIIDLAVAHPSSGSIGLWRGDGAADFTGPDVSLLGGNPRAVASADFDRDGFADLAVTMELAGQIGVLRGTSLGFERPQTFPALARPVAIATADFDEDGQSDVISASAAVPGGIVLLATEP